MSFTRIPLKITRIFEIHRDQTNILAHSSGNNPLYSTVNILTTAATTKFSGLNPRTNKRYYSLYQLDDVFILGGMKNYSVFQYEAASKVWGSKVVLKVFDCTLGGTSIVTNSQVSIPNASSTVSGMSKYASSSTAFTESSLIATPTSAKNQLNKQLMPNLIVMTNVIKAKWYLDSDTSKKYQSGSAVNVTAGSHTIHFEAVNGYSAKPDDVTVTVGTSTVVVERQYTPSTVVVIGCLNNASATWSPNGGTTNYASGVPVKLAAGDYNITFSDVSGKTTPATQLLKLTAAAEKQDKEVSFFAFYT